jgi:hypothetical protein
MPFHTALGYTARMIDPVMRQRNSVVDEIMSKVPGLSQLLPPQVDVYGAEKTQPGGLFGRMQPMVVVATAKQLDEVDRELERLHYSISFPGYSYSVGKQKQLLDKDEWIQLTKENGPAIKKALAYLMFEATTTGNPGDPLLWGMLDDDQKRHAADNIVRNIHQQKLTAFKLAKFPIPNQPTGVQP